VMYLHQGRFLQCLGACKNKLIVNSIIIGGLK
jgi:hypothetical protein